MNKIAIMGATGSIGTQSLDVIEKNPDKFRVSALSCGKNIELFSKQIEKFKPELAVCAEEKDALLLKKKHPHTEFEFGAKGLVSLASKTNADIVLNALMGMRGLEPTYYAILAHKKIALANKETLVAGGNVIMEAAKENCCDIIPVDSEHSAIFQCLQGNNPKEMKKILLTASGGPFRGYCERQLESVTLKDALKHPNWSMGKKITVDSATMMNKGLEVIEAKWLFDIADHEKEIQVIIHPESIVHSMVEYIDGSVIAQMGIPDMRTPIAYAFSYPERIEMKDHAADFFKIGKLTFEKPDTVTFKCLALAYEALSNGGSYPVVLNAANEVLVQKFLEEKIRFTDIQKNLEIILNEHKPTFNLGLSDIIQIDIETRKLCEERR